MLSENAILVLLTLPYVIDLVVGLFMIYFLANLIDFEDKSLDKEIIDGSYELELPLNFQVIGECIICTE